jgi:hypothetical protein
MGDSIFSFDKTYKKERRMSLIYAVVQRRMLLFCCQKNGNDKDSERELKAYVKFKIIGSGAKCINGFPIKRT